MNTLNSDQSSAILVGLDGSGSSFAALRYAARLAEALRAPLRVVAVWHYQSTGFAVPPIGLVSVPLDDEPKRKAEALVQDAVESVLHAAFPFGLETAVIEGTPAEVLISESAGAEMLVLGSRGHGGFTGLLLGSVSAACAAHAHCPVLVMHSKGDHPQVRLPD